MSSREELLLTAAELIVQLTPEQLTAAISAALNADPTEIIDNGQNNVGGTKENVYFHA